MWVGRRRVLLVRCDEWWLDGLVRGCLTPCAGRASLRLNIHSVAASCSSAAMHSQSTTWLQNHTGTCRAGCGTTEVCAGQAAALTIVAAGQIKEHARDVGAQQRPCVAHCEPQRDPKNGRESSQRASSVHGWLRPWTYAQQGVPCMPPLQAHDAALSVHVHWCVRPRTCVVKRQPQCPLRSLQQCHQPACLHRIGAVHAHIAQHEQHEAQRWQA